MEGFGGKTNLQALGSSPAQLGKLRLASANVGCFRVCCSRCWQQPASLRKTATTLALLTCYTDSKVSGFVAVTSHISFACEMKFSMDSCCQPKQHPLLRFIFRSIICLWVKMWYRNKEACSASNPVQSSRSKLTTCPRKGCLLRLKLNCTATSDGDAQKLGNNVWRDSEPIATNVCSQIGRKWNAMFESHVATTQASIDRTSFDFEFDDFSSNLPP